MRKFTVKLFTTQKDGWEYGKFPLNEIEDIFVKINSSIKGGQILELHMQYINPVKLDVQVTKEKGMDMSWFRKNLTPLADKGENIVVLHMTDKDRKRYGIRKTLNGQYSADNDDILEFWLCANKGEMAKHYRDHKKITEFRRVFVHELLHGFYRKTGVDTEHVHFFDYNLRDVELGLKVVNFK